MSDLIIIGAGIAGATVAHAAKEAGLKVTVLERDSVCSGGSHAAGAFLSPKISKPSPYKTLLNRALAYSLSFYEKNFPDLLHKSGLWKLPLDAEDTKRLQSYEPYIDITWERKGDGYFFPDAGIVDPHKVCEALLAGIALHEKINVVSLHRDEAAWIACDDRGRSHRARYLVLATGSAPDLIPLPCLRRKNIGGYRYDVRFDGQEKITCNIHKDCSISTFLQKEHKTIVGATHIREKIDLENAAREDRYRLIERASETVPMPDVQILKSYTGYRNFSFDYFPILGPAVDAHSTLEAFPAIQKGARVPLERYSYYPDLYLHTALGSRGFVFAPWLATMLIEAIIHKKAIETPLLPATRFRKWAQKRQKL